jgi:hypothetical protein
MPSTLQKENGLLDLIEYEKHDLAAGIREVLHNNDAFRSNV